MTSHRKRLEEKIVFAVLGTICFGVILIVMLIVGFIVVKGVQAISWEFVSAMPRKGMKEGGIFPAIVGTLLLIGGTILSALPLGIGAALYLTEYAKKGPLSRMIRIAIFNLAGIPSVVYGLFGLGVFVLFLNLGTSVLAGSLTLACLVLPVVITASEEALLAVDPGYREASLALGATKLQTIRRIVLPHALPGIVTGAVLAMGRAAGETAPILLTAAAFFLPRLPRSPFDPIMALPYHLYIISTQVPGMPERIKYGTALVLLFLVSLFFIPATLIRLRIRRSRRG